MTYQEDFTLPIEILEQVAVQGLDFLPELIRIVINSAMQVERQKYLGVGPYERSAERRRRSNGFKSKTVSTRIAPITFDILQVREGGFYPQALEKGLRSERALMLALAEMYVQGVSTRKVAAITERLCGSEISSTRVSRRGGALQRDCVRSGSWPHHGPFLDHRPALWRTLCGYFCKTGLGACGGCPLHG